MLSVLMPFVLLLPQEPARQDGKFSLEMFPLQHLCSDRPGLTPPMWGSMLQYLRPDDDRRLDLLGTREEGAQFDPSQVQDLLNSLHGNAIASGTLSMSVQFGNLVVFGDGPSMALIREQVRELGALVTRPLQVEVTLWDAGDGAPAGPVLGPREFTQFAGQHTAVWRSHSQTRSSMPVALDGQRWVRYVRDVDVEVAQKATISHPQTDAFGEGGRVVVAPHSLLGGDDLVLHVQFGLANRRGAVRSIPTSIAEQADLDVPLLDTTYGACSGRINNGGALAVTMTGLAASGCRQVLTVRVTSKVPPTAPQSASIGIFPISAMSSAAFRQVVAPPDPYPVVGDNAPETPSIQAETDDGYLPPEHVMELIRTSLGAEATEEGFAMQYGGGYLFVLAPAAMVARTDEILRALQDRVLRTVTVHHTVTLAPGEGADPTKPTILHDLVVPTLLGRRATVCRQVETNVIRDVFVEIAQESSNSDPQVEALQTGAWLRARVSPIADGMHLQLLAQCSHGEAGQPRRVAPAGALTLTDVASTRAAHDGAVASAQPVDHGDGPVVTIGGRACRSAMVTTVTW